MSPQLLEAPVRKDRRPQPVPPATTTETAAEQPLYDVYSREHFQLKNVDWPVLGWMVGIHV
ncbi:MAG: hypothetical protein WD176_01175, partial [Pirellulales bacterium]